MPKSLAAVSALTTGPAVDGCRKARGCRTNGSVLLSKTGTILLLSAIGLLPACRGACTLSSAREAAADTRELAGAAVGIAVDAGKDGLAWVDSHADTVRGIPKHVLSKLEQAYESVRKDPCHAIGLAVDVADGDARSAALGIGVAALEHLGLPPRDLLKYARRHLPSSGLLGTAASGLAIGAESYLGVRNLLDDILVGVCHAAAR